LALCLLSMVKTKTLIRLTFLGALLSWVFLVFSDVVVLFNNLKSLPSDVPSWLPRVMLDLYIISLFYYYKFRIERDENLNFTDLLWKVFATGLIATVASLAVRLIVYLLGSTKLASNILFIDLIYQIIFYWQPILLGKD
jgi:phosphoserine phosphatase RsbU/P